jgi:hypothetical protein
MVKVLFFIVSSSIVSIQCFAQDTLTHINGPQTDSAHRYSNNALDSIQTKFWHKTDSLQKVHSSRITKIRLSITKLSHRKDSLSRVSFCVPSDIQKLDSIQKEIKRFEQKHTNEVKELNGKIDKVKSDALKKIAVLHLPPQAQNEINALTKNIQGFKIPNSFSQLPGMNSLSKGINIPGLSRMSLSLPSNLNIPEVKIPSLQKFNLVSLATLPPFKQLEGSLGKEISQLKSNASVESLEKNAVKELSQNAEVKSLLKEETQVKEMEGKLSQMKDTKGAEALAKQQLPAINHFEGKEKELQSAITEVSKYKQKYGNIKSLEELPRRAPNPLKDKPWIERIVLGLNYFILSKHATFIDFNPYAGWRFNPRITASIGWSERVGIVHGQASTSDHERVYGVRTSFSYKWAKGFSFRLSPEVMSAYVPTNTPDNSERILVFGLFAGIRKDFKIYKGLIGYSEGLYNFTQKSGQNIYGDRLSLRLGFEMRNKKKAIKGNR